MECNFLENHDKYHRYDVDHILISFKNYYNNNYCMLNFITTLLPEDKPQVITRDCASELIKILIQNKHTNRYPICLVGSDSPAMREIYLFIMNTFCGGRFEIEPSMNVYSLLEGVWEERFKKIANKKWNKSKPKRLIDASTQ